MHIVVTTTIYPPHHLRAWATAMTPGEDVIIVSGDQKTPHNEVRAVLDKIMEETGVGVQYCPRESCWPRTSNAVGWNTVQRRNIAILSAMMLGPDYITTVDTDNYPVRPDHLRQIQQLMTEPYTDRRWRSLNTWANPGEQLQPQVIHRGIPLSHRKSLSRMTLPNVGKTDPLKIGVHSSLWWGDPDIDAIERLHSDPVIERHMNPEQLTVYAPGVWAPFNSQATTFVQELFPLLFVLPGIGRYDDIWASYIARVIMEKFGYVTAYGKPYVIQERHEHDALVDLEREMYGMRTTHAFVDFLRDIDLSAASTVYEALQEIINALCDGWHLPDQTMRFLNAWALDVYNAMGFGEEGVK
jgi:hypothetical protein